MPTPLPVLAFGGDYNPEQWPREAHVEDRALMREAGVDLVTLGVFSWAWLQPSPDTWDFAWLDEQMDELHAAGIRVDLATATASPPPWLTHQHPEMLPVTHDGRTLSPGGRQAFCPSSPVYREHALALCRALGERYADHPALAMWHVSNELGCHNARCYCDVSADAFRTWLRHRYADVAHLNDAWGTAFWSQRYTDFEQVLPPRAAPAHANPTQQLDFLRFSSDQLLDNFVVERDVLHEVSPGVPVTTNFMVMRQTFEMDYLRWGRELDIVSNDHYLIAAEDGGHRELAFSADLTRGTAGGRPWLLMEHSTSAVNWQPRNRAKVPGEMIRNSLAHVARGADAVLFFQWRASRAGAEKFHSGLLPHAGTDTRQWREVVELSQLLDRVEEVAGSVPRNQAAILFDYEAWWGCELDSHPSVDVHYRDRAEDLHRALTALGVGVDVVHPSADLSAYDLVLVPTLYLVTDEAAAAVAAAAERGATVVVTYFSGIVDEHDHIRLGGYPGAFRELLGVRTTELLPLLSGEVVRVDGLGEGGLEADTWAEDLELSGASAVATHADGPARGLPAVTRRDVGSGAAWYVATRLSPQGTDRLVERLVAEAGVERLPGAGPDVEVTRRVGADASWLFVINHGEQDAPVAVSGHDLAADRAVSGDLVVPAGGVAVVREERG
ncbi:beta-galactosidase [Nocardioides sp. Root122]|uniref:beta-galactosidase n=1 Tax=Nocardioides TaxID=1839 RepID=UPI000702914F|nr:MULTISPECIES: beta-galactosidase [Nocardioides]KQV71340.1 beta-galactosidase [Nocardioides sp. Root122]MCK9822703.1 beta-galactosidase [Nocardioides cavernae]